MRLRTVLSSRLVAAAALLATSVSASAVVPAPARAASLAPLPSCATAADRGFPLTTRIHGGPRTYTAGGGHGTWQLDLTNTTDRACAGIHPVVVLVDEARALQPSQAVLEFYDGGGRPHPVRFVRTEEDELVGALADDRAGFRGFTVRPGRTLRVKVRLAVTSDAVANEVTANAAVVQRRAGDGEWVGQSNDYRFRVAAQEPGARQSPGESGETKGTEETGDSLETGETRETEETEETAESSETEEAGETKEGGESEGPGSATATLSPSPLTPFDRIPFADELAGTGLARTTVALVAGALLVLTGAGAVLLARRRPGRR
ncbi:hypothetical protein ACIHFC_02315 [Streptomyces sp. NPDC052013]|uniref:hypothetical protein n=1 Tax=Streptomyces sp. NPDC052013 TaxID=3365679 RepID=UPI0037D7C16F